MTKAQSKETLSGHTPSVEESPKAAVVTGGETSKGPEELEVSEKEKDVPPSESNVPAETGPGSDDNSNSSMGDDWVNLSNTAHPLVAGNN